MTLSQVSASEDASSAGEIELDEVLDPAFLGIEQAAHIDHYSEDHVDTSRAPHLENLRRWDRIPVATFRQTRQVLALDSPKTASHLNTNFAGQAILGSSSHIKAKAKGKARVAQAAPPSVGCVDNRSGTVIHSQRQIHTHQNKSKKDARLDRAAKRKMVEKTSPRRLHNHHHHHHHHYPNTKSRSSSSLQRTHSSFTSAGSSFLHPSF